jgi:hypothetical protein
MDEMKNKNFWEELIAYIAFIRHGRHRKQKRGGDKDIYRQTHREQGDLISLVLFFKIKIVDSKRFWRWCVTLRITGFLEFAHRLALKKNNNKRTERFGKWIYFRPQVSPTPHLMTETGPIFETLYSYVLFFRIPDDGPSPKSR